MQTAAALVTLVFALLYGTPQAWPAEQKLLARLDTVEHGDCAVVTINFAYQVEYLSHSPFTQGDQLRILLHPMDPKFAARKVLTDVESLAPPASKLAAIHAIELEVDPSQAALNVYFNRSVSYTVEAGADFKSLAITVSNGKPGETCQPEKTPVHTEAAVPPVKLRPPGVMAAAIIVEAPPAGDLGKLHGDARAALTAGRYEDAIRLFTKVLETPKGPHAREARELLGLARQKNNQLAHAEAEYRQYLIDYPGSADGARVQQRLDGVIALENKPFDDIHKATEERQKQADEIAVAQARQTTLAEASQATRARLPGISVQGQPVKSLPGPGGATLLPKSGWQRSYDGSVGVYYSRNQGADEIIDRFNPTAASIVTPKVYQDGVIGQLDLRGSVSNSEFVGKIALSGSRDRNFLSDSLDFTRIGQLYAEANWIERGLTERLGRQTRYAGGVLGRFDGSLTSLDLDQGRRINLTIGSPVDRTRDNPFLLGRYFYGLSYDFVLPFKGWDASVYGVEQKVAGELDRRAIGYDLHYKSDALLLFHTFDYDLNFQQLNTLIVSGSYAFKDRSTLGFDVDYRKSPSLFASNALQGQQTDRLGDLLGRYNYAEVAQLASDRSADTYNLTLSYNRQISEHLQFYGDLNESYMGATAASGGVDAMAAEGFDSYATAQLIGTGFLRDNDLYVGGLRFAKSSTSNQYELELGVKYPLTDAWRISPASKFGYKTFGTDGHTEFHFLPSIGLNYAISRDQSIELDAGAHMTQRYVGAGTEHDWDMLLTAGYRYDFYSAQ